MVVLEREELELYEKAGKIASQVRREAAERVLEGKRLIDLASFVDVRIAELGAKPAFPINISINEISAHYTPGRDDESRFANGDLAKIDIGVHIDGYISDTAVTVLVGGGEDGSPESERKLSMIKASKEALDAAIRVAGPNVPLSDVGAAIEGAIKARGFLPVRNLTGHNVEQWILHAGLSINNYAGQAGVLEPGMIVAIEPFATDGAGRVIESKNSLIYSVTLHTKNVRLRQGRDLLQNFFDSYNMLPFARRWIDPAQARFLNPLIISGALHVYPILKEAGGGLVSQAEHTLYIGEKGVKVLSE